MRMPAYYRNLPVARKLQWASMVVGLTAMLLASAYLLVDDQIKDREGMRHDLEVLANIFSANSTAALTFSDAEAATELLATLDAKQHITDAYLYTADGKPFASYHRTAGPAGGTLPPLQADGIRFDTQRVTVIKSILNGKQKIGSVILVSDLGELQEQLQHFLWMVFALIVGASLIATALSSRLQRPILEPIAHLAAVARLVSAGKNYGARAVKQ